METKKDGRGGRRAGAGRPKGDSKSYSFRVPGSLARQLDQIDNKTEFIRESLTDALALAAIGEAVPAHSVVKMQLPLYETRVVAGFPVPLDSDERSRDIELLSMLCPHPESSYLVRVNGESMIDAGILSGDIVIVDKSNRTPSPRE
jgi:SOS-response transcriptional repressors (RecA-mediated autopeptidases)